MMKNLHTGALTLIGALLVSAGSVIAEERWYRVELLVFSQPPSATVNDEAWDFEPALGYPDEVRFLVDPDQLAANEISHPGETSLDNRGRQTIYLAAEEEEEEEAKEEASESPLSPETPLPVEPNSAIDIIEPLQSEGGPEEPLLLPEAYLIRPATELEFAGKAAYMERRGGYEKLFHQSWLQPLSEQADTLPIVLDRSGDQQSYPRLQGSIQIYLSRYAHLETNLWLNTDGRYLNSDWQMPAPPLGPPSLLIIEADGMDEPPVTTAPMFEADDVVPLESTAESLAPAEQFDTAPVYPFRHAVLLREQRRMRGDEVHYLDHPMLGVIVKLTSLSTTELDAIARSDAALSSGETDLQQPAE